VNRFPMIERAVKELIETRYEPAAGRVGGDLSYDGSSDLYVWIGLVPGGGTDEINGLWVLDIDCFARTYSAAMDAALDLETVLIGRRLVTSVMLLDTGSQNEVPSERAWDDDSSYRVGATYVFTARRSG